MPKMLSLRNFRLASITGHVALFTANEPMDVPDALVQEAMAAGCVPVNADDIPFYEDVGRAQVEFQGDIRRSTIYLAVQSVMVGNEIKNFDGGGVPKHDLISDRLGFMVSRDEVRAIYQMYTAAKVEGREFGLHPASANILRVVDAESKAELVELASELFGMDPKQSKGLQIKELRKVMLTKLNGVVAAG